VVDEVGTLVRGEESERGREELTDVLEGARPHRAEEGFEFGEGLFDRIEIGAVGREKADEGADAFDRRADLRLFVDGEIVEYDDIAGPERRHEHLVDVGEKRGIVDRAIEDGRRREALQAQARDHRTRLPVPARRVIAEAQAARAPAIPPDQIGGHATFVQKHVVPRVGQGLPLAPPAPFSGDVRPALFVRVYRFF
jgi:hypothetical protein